jgi:hypothetical protein
MNNLQILIGLVVVIGIIVVVLWQMGYIFDDGTAAAEEAAELAAVIASDAAAAAAAADELARQGDVAPGPPRIRTTFPSEIRGLVGRYTYDSAEQNIWRDLSGKANHGEVSGGLLMKKDKYVYGGVGDSVIFPKDMTGRSDAYTLFFVARYNGPNRKRIFGDMTGNWLSGFHDGDAGVARHGAWITPEKPTYNHKFDWVIGTDQSKMFRSNRTDRTTAPDAGTQKLTQLCINTGANSSQFSDWAVKEILFYDRELRDIHIKQIEDYLDSTHITRTPPGLITKRGKFPKDDPGFIEFEPGVIKDDDLARGDFHGTDERCRQIAIEQGYPMWGYRTSAVAYPEANTCFFHEEGYSDFAEDVAEDWKIDPTVYMGCTDPSKNPNKTCL